MKTSTTRDRNEQRLDPGSQQYVDQQRAAAREQYDWLQRFRDPYAGQYDPNVSGYLTDAAGGFGGYANAGQLGLRALSGDREAYGQLLNPMLGELDSIYNSSADLALNRANEAATHANAFGSRADVLRGSLLGSVARDRAAARVAAGEQAFGRAGQLAGFGMGANQALAGIGQYLTDSDRQALQMRYGDYLRQQGVPQQALGLLNAGMGPYGMDTTMIRQNQSSPLMQGLGLLLPLLGPGGAGAGILSQLLGGGGGGGGGGGSPLPANYDPNAPGYRR